MNITIKTSMTNMMNKKKTLMVMKIIRCTNDWFRKGMVMDMNRIILASHGGMSAGALDTAELILGEVPNLYAVSTTRDETETIIQEATRLLESFSPEDKVYILTDVLGGSVNNDMLSLIHEYEDITVICGMNMGLVLSLATQDEPLSDEELEDVIQQSRAQLVDCTRVLKRALEEEEEEDDL